MLRWRERHAGMLEIMKARCAEARLLADFAPATAQIVGLYRGAARR